MTKLASIERRNGEFIVASYTQTPPGFWQMNGHFRRVASDADPSDLGQVLLDALDASNRTPLRDIDASSNSFGPVLAELGLKNYAQYMKGATSVSLEIGNDGLLKVTPMRNGGAREGFVELTDKAQVLLDRSASSVGDAVEQAMADERG